MSAPSPAKRLLTILVVLCCLIVGTSAYAEETDPFPNLVSHNAVSHFVATFTGAAGASIPIVVPPGRNAMQPSLALSYNSFMRNGWVGVGWNVELGAIRRNTKHGLDYDGSDFLAGDAELIRWPEWGGDAYRAKIEGEFSRYFYDSTGDAWRVQAKDGRVMYFGSTANSRQSNTHGTFKWCLDRVEDPNGNYMTLSYT
ncbi:MAG: hypothetical protein HZB24_06390 [Desulfobacterales bacterium]|nr:hypothetical protein [Desulfobacterales bacterium]